MDVLLHVAMYRKQEPLLELTHWLDAVEQGAALLRSTAVHWIPEFGCAILVLGPDASTADIHMLPDMAYMYLVGLDDWSHRIHR